MYSVVKGVSYVLAHTPDMVVHNGTTQTTQRKIDPNVEYLTEINKSLRSYEDALSYMPNQVYIGNMTPQELSGHELPWADKKARIATRKGTYGEIMPQDEFIGLMKLADVFDLVLLEESFSNAAHKALSGHELFSADKLEPLTKGIPLADLEKLVAEGVVEGIYNKTALVGCVKQAHEIDVSLSAHVIFENLVAKASGTLAVMHLMSREGLRSEDVEYVIECSEEACGDMNQRGGGNFAKSIAEAAGLTNATGSDIRGFCAAPMHAMLQGASLVKAGTFKQVVVAAGGSTAKLGMNGKDHVKKGLPILEDCIAGFAILIGENDGINPEINTDIVGRHTVGTGSSPQKVIEALASIPLMKAGMKLTDIDKYAVEMQNPDITKPAGAGDVAEANYKMIGALAAIQGHIAKAELPDFVKKHGMSGWAPTQGHIPSGVPYLGFAREALMNQSIERAMFIGKGSLFLGRMTNLFDGVSFILQQNSREKSGEESVSGDQVKQLIATALKDFAAHLVKD